MSIPELSQSIKERKLSYLQAVLFYLEQYNIYNDRLSYWVRQQIQEIEKEPLKLRTAKEAKTHFDSFFKTLILEFSKSLNIPDDDAHEQLDEAEMLYVWSKQREPVTSDPIEMQLPTGTRFSVTQNDIPIEHTTLEQKIEWLKILSNDPPQWFLGLSKLTQRFLQNELINVVNQISKIDILADKEGTALVDEYLKIFKPSPPHWFRSLSPQQQAELKTHIRSIRMHTIPCHLRTVPNLANYGKHLVTFETTKGVTITTQRYRHSLIVPYGVKTPEKSNTQSELIRLTTQNIRQLLGNTESDEQSPLYQVTKRFVEEWDIKPNRASHLIEIPVLIQTFISPLAKKLVQLIGLLKIGHLEQERLSMEILAQVIENLQRPGVLPTYTFEINGQTYYIKPKLTHSNYPLNGARFPLDAVPQGWSETKQRNLRNATQLLNNAGTFLSQTLLKGTQIQAFINALKETTSVTTFAFDNWKTLKQEIEAISETILSTQRKLDLKILIDALRDYAELYHLLQEEKESRQLILDSLKGKDSFRLILASLEEIITERSGGLTTGSCKTAKDRKGMETIHTDAMLTYYILYGRFPKWNDTPETQERKNFAAIYAALFNSGQQHRWAATNAPGAYGFEHLQVTPQFLSPIPSDLLDAIFKDAPEKLRQSDLLGHLFRPKNPLKEEDLYLTPPSQSMFPKPELSTISNLVAEHEEEQSIPLSQPIQLQQPKETLKAIYFPEGSSHDYRTNTVELVGGKTKDHIDAAASCAMEYFTRNPDPDGIIELTGHPKVVETLQWIFVAAFGIDSSYIKIPHHCQLIQVKVKNGLIQVPPQFQTAVNQAKQLIQKRQQLAFQTEVTYNEPFIQERPTLAGPSLVPPVGAV